LNTLAGLVSGIVGSRRSNLTAIADKVPGGPSGQTTKVESRVKRFERWLRNDAVKSETFFLPFAKALLLSLCHVPLVLVIDGSIVGRGCMTLMISLVYKQRGLPIVWTVAKRRKGHFPERVHIELMNKVRDLIPEGARVVLLGDGEFDGVDLQALVNQCKWEYVLRTSKSARLSWRGEEFRFDDVVAHVNPGDLFEVPNALFTQREYGPVLAPHVVEERLQGAHPSGYEHGLGAGSLRLLPQAVQNRDILLGSEKPWISLTQDPLIGPETLVSPHDCHVPRCLLDRLSWGIRHGVWSEQRSSTVPTDAI
jgi:hypothetical protein